MQRKPLLFLVVGFLIIVGGRSVTAQTRSVFWEDWNVTIDNVDTAANHFDVTEFYRINFSGTFRFGTAVLEDTRLESIQDVRVSERGEALRASCSEQPGTYCVTQVQEGVSVVYYFNQPISNASQTFELSYTVYGALRVYEGGDQLWWTAIPSEKYGFPVGRSVITVELPQGFAPREGIDPIESYGAPTDIKVNGRVVTARATRQIGGNESLEIRVQYPHDPNAVEASWQGDYDEQVAFEEDVKPLLDLLMIALGLLLAVAGPLGVFTLWYSRGRDPKTGPVPEYLSEPPSDLPPALVGTLVDERADLRDILSTLIDLGHRGYLVVEEDKKEGMFGIGGKATFEFKRTDKPTDDLRPYEQHIIKKVFGGRLERSLDSMKDKFYQYLPKLEDDLYDGLVSEGLFTAKPSTTRQMYSGLGVVVLIVAGIIGAALMPQVENFTPTVLCLPVALGFSGVGLSIVGQFMPRKTRKGAEEAAKWDAFRTYLRNVDKYDDLEAAGERFSAYLPYAIAFGIDRSWIRRMSKVNTVTPPIWYWPTHRGGYYGRGYRAGSPVRRSAGLPSAGDVLPGDVARAGGGGGGLDDLSGDLAGGLESLSSGLTNMLESASRTFQSRPASKSSGSWSSGGRSFSGGGSFGGSSGGGSRGFG